METSCDTCQPVRLRTASGDPVSPILWLHRDLTKLSQFTAPSEIKDGDKTTPVDARFDVVGRERKLIGETLIWEIRITLNDPRPTTFMGRIWAAWQAHLEVRRAERFFWAYSGATVAVGLMIVIGIILSSGIGHAIVFETLASMVWIWVQFGSLLPWLTAGLCLFYAIRAFLKERPFILGLAVMSSFLLTVLAVDLRAVLFDVLPSNPQFPVDYRQAGYAIVGLVGDGEGGWNDQLKTLWSIATLLLNSAGLAGVVAVVDTGASWVFGLAKPQADAIGTTSTMAPPDRVSSQRWGDAIFAATGAKRIDDQEPFRLEVPLTPINDPNDNIPMRPLAC